MRWPHPTAPVLAALAAAAVWFGTPWGLGLSPDSFAYLSAARALLEHGDLARLPTHWPPGYPLLLAAVGGIAGDVAGAARVLHALLFALNALLLVLLARRAAGHPALALVLVVALLLHPVLLQPHLVLWTEPAFLALLLADWLILLQCMQHAPRTGVVLALGVIAGLALLLRYAGAHLLVLNALAIALLGAGDLRRRIAAGAAAGLLGALPLLAWLALMAQRHDAESIRELAWHPPGLAQWQGIGATMAGWFGMPRAAAWPALTALLLLGFLRWRHRPNRPGDDALARVLILSGLCYAGFVLLSASLFDAHIPFDDRMLLPLLPAVVLLLVAGFRPLPPHWPSLALLALLFAALAFGASAGVRLWLASRHDGIGLSSRPLQQLPVWRRLATLPHDWHVVTNGPELFVLHLGRPAHTLPRGMEPGTRRRNPDFAREMDALSARADAIVVFAPMRFRGYLPPPEVIDRLPAFRREYDAADAIVWLRTEPRTPPPDRTR